MERRLARHPRHRVDRRPRHPLVLEEEGEDVVVAEDTAGVEGGDSAAIGCRDINGKVVILIDVE